MAATDARNICIKNTLFRVEFPILDAVTGNPVTGAAGLDSEVSQNSGTFADCTNEATEIATSSGSYYLDLTGAETNTDNLAVQVKTSTTDAMTTILVLNPVTLPSISTGTLSAGSAGGGTLGTILAYDITGCYIQTTGGTGGGGSGGAANQARKIITYNTSTGAFTVGPNWGTTPDNTTTYSVLLPEGLTIGALKALNPATAGRTVNVSAGGVADADTVAISTDTAAANALETMLDGAGGNALTVSNLVISGNLSVAGTSTYTGAVSFGDALNVAGIVTFASDVEINGTFNMGGDLAVGGVTNFTGGVNLNSHLTIGGNLTIAGTTGLNGAFTTTNAGNDIRLGATERTNIANSTNTVLSTAHGSGPWGYLPGPGPNAITVTVTDGSSDLQSAAVGLYQANVLIANGVTDVNGNITFSLAAGTYEVVVSKGNYQFTPTSRTVTGPQTGTLVNDLVMTQISPVTPPVNPSLCNVYGFLIDPEGNPAANVEVSFTLTAPNGRRPTTSGGLVVNFVSVTAMTDGAGFVSQDLIRTDVLDQANYQYTIACESADFNVRTAVAAATLDLASL